MAKLTEEIFNGKKSVNDILEERINLQKSSEIFIAKKTLDAGDLEETMDDIESNYRFNQEKNEYVAELQSKDIKLQKKFLEMIMFIDNQNLSNYNLISTLLTCGCLLEQDICHLEFLNNEELYLVSTAMISVPVDSYRYYIEIISNKNVLISIRNKTSNMNEQRNMIYDILDYCDEFVSDDMSKENYENAIKDSLNIISKYQVKENEKTK